MARAKTNKFYRTFSKGLITEAGYLTYPEDASSDELNTILSRKGNRSRRLGFDYQNEFLLNNLPAGEDVATAEFVWKAVNNNPNVSFACLQVGYRVHFFQMNTEALSAQKKSFVVDLINYKIPTATTEELTSEYCDMSAGSGFLFIANRFMDPVSVEYVPETGTIIVIPIVIQVRDFEGVYDRLANDEEPLDLSAQHHYNLLNQGWVTPGTKSIDISAPDYGTPPNDAVTPTVVGDANVPNGEPSYYDEYLGQTIYRKTGGI